VDEFLKELEQLLRKYEVWNMQGGYGGEVEISAEKFEVEVNMEFKNFDKNQTEFTVHKKEEV